MTLTTSPKFASAAASGTDWRDTAKAVLEDLQKAITAENQFNFGFLYISDLLAGDVESILNLFKSVTGINHWIGCTGIGVCAGGQELLDVPAISAMIGNFEPGNIQLFSAQDQDVSAVGLGAIDKKDWVLTKFMPMLVLAHGDPMADLDPMQGLFHLDETIGGFILGGLTSSRSTHHHFAENLSDGNYSGAAFSEEVAVSTAISQGCQPIGDLHTITKCEDHIIYEIDDRPPFEVFEDDLRQMVIQKTGQDPDKIFLEEPGFEKGQYTVPHEFEELFQGDMHVAFAVPGSDNQDYLVRNIIGMDEDEGILAVSHKAEVGDHILFAHRDDKTIQAELSAMLISLRERVIKERGEFNPQGALYISCAGRAYSNNTVKPSAGEMNLIKEIIGDIPITGFYASGEISGGRLYGYTGVLTLFF